MRPRSRLFLDKSLGAMLAAIEIYNKPVFSYREESFAILATNAWELLLKARLLQLASNKLASINTGNYYATALRVSPMPASGRSLVRARYNRIKSDQSIVRTGQELHLGSRPTIGQAGQGSSWANTTGITPAG